MTRTERLFVIFQREFLNNILIMHPLVKQYDDILKLEEMKNWFVYKNLPPSIEAEIKEYWKDTLFGNNPYYLDPEFFQIIPIALFNSLCIGNMMGHLVEPEEDVIMTHGPLLNFKDVISEAMGGYYGLVDYDSEDNIIPNEESNRWGDEEGNYHLDGHSPDWDLTLKGDSEIFRFVQKFQNGRRFYPQRYIIESDHYILYSERLLKKINYNSVNERINGSLELYGNKSYFNLEHIKIPPFIPTVVLPLFELDGIYLFTDCQVNYFSESIPAGISFHNTNNRYYFPQDFLQNEYEYEAQDSRQALKFECKFRNVDDYGEPIRSPLSIKSLVSEYKCLTKEITLNKDRIAYLSARYGYDYEDFCQAVLCKNLGFWLTQDLCAYPTQWFLRIDMEFLHYYSDYFANMLCENESQKNILALLALFGTKEHQSYYRTPVDVLSKSNFTLSIIDHLPSLKTDWNPHLHRPWLKKEDYEPDQMEAYQLELLKSYIPIDERKNQFPENFQLNEVFESFRNSEFQFR